MSDDKSVEESLKALEDSLEASRKELGQNLSQGAALQVEDLNEKAAQFLTPSAKYDLTRKSTQLLVIEEGNTFKPVYFAVRVRRGNQEKALLALTRVVNKLSEQGMIHSFLSGFASLDLAVQPMEAPQSVVFVFPLVPANAEFNVRHRFSKLAILEGGMGEAIEDMELDREEGEFFSVIRVTAMSRLLDQANPKERLDEEIAVLLAVLPKGTVVRKVTECAITDLSVPYEVKFFHPFMKDIRRVELNYTRTISRHEHGIHQFNLLTGVSYFGHDDKLLFRESR
jgi:hypothetical protein